MQKREASDEEVEASGMFTRPGRKTPKTTLVTAMKAHSDPRLTADQHYPL